jgi:hypothetical protein
MINNFNITLDQNVYHISQIDYEDNLGIIEIHVD